MSKLTCQVPRLKFKAYIGLKERENWSDSYKHKRLCFWGCLWLKYKIYIHILAAEIKELKGWELESIHMLGTETKPAGLVCSTNGWRPKQAGMKWINCTRIQRQQAVPRNLHLPCDCKRTNRKFKSGHKEFDASAYETAMRSQCCPAGRRVSILAVSLLDEDSKYFTFFFFFSIF